MVRCSRGGEWSDLSAALPRVQDCCLTEVSACVDHCLVLGLGGGGRRAGLHGLLLSSPEALGWTRLMVCILEPSSHESGNQKDFKKEKKIPRKKFLVVACPPPPPAVAAQLRLISTSFLVEFFKKDLSVGVSAVVQIFTVAACLALCLEKCQSCRKVGGVSTVNLQMPLCSQHLPVCFAPPPPCLLVTGLTKLLETRLFWGPSPLRTDLLRRGTFFHTVGVRRGLHSEHWCGP